MQPSDHALTERVAKSVKQLTHLATDLNAASDELGKTILAIDAILKHLNIGVPTWVVIERGNSLPDGESYWSRNLGYAKVGNKWGVSLSTVEGNYNEPEYESVDCWLFNDAPRWLRIEGVDKIPDLLEALIRDTEETTLRVRNKIVQANQFAAAIAQAAGELKQRGRK